ncbi:MAG TPA: hypothetical protein PKD72_15220 [Gemmatales bacterium]|nr:hypothetical protein [Gemmatales bacterium]
MLDLSPSPITSTHTTKKIKSVGMIYAELQLQGKGQAIDHADKTLHHS